MTVPSTHIGGPAALVEVGGWRLLTDPALDPTRAAAPASAGAPAPEG